ncbi:hypothetical protein PILCRDRAFT_776043 [Piloderma croceum F 1598]|uniref:Uncharacterized protein n=1 Tax=Piloderma croceum (strain F 1598) TaxID=765440 RepID=A0A0C3FPE2_PILCF|nr:hypothetical protein PILCRDRAFT_776043 [Piloderma croceum F 1598]
MGWGGQFISHFFTTIHWGSIHTLIKKMYPDMQLKQHKTVKTKSMATELFDKMLNLNPMEDVIEDDTVQIASVAGTLQIKDQIKEYMDQGGALEDMSFLQFCLDTYETEEKPPSDNGCGRKAKERIPYLEGTGHGKKCRVIKGIGHETMPNFVDSLTSAGRNANDETLNEIEYTQRAVKNNLVARFSADDRLFAEVALNIAKHCVS